MSNDALAPMRVQHDATSDGPLDVGLIPGTTVALELNDSTTAQAVRLTRVAGDKDVDVGSPGDAVGDGVVALVARKHSDPTIGAAPLVNDDGELLTTGTITVAEPVPADPAVVTNDGTPLAVGDNASLNADAIPNGTTRRLWGVDINATAQCRIEMFRVLANIVEAAPFAVVTVANGAPYVPWRAPHAALAAIASTNDAGFNFRFNVTSLEPANGDALTVRLALIAEDR